MSCITNYNDYTRSDIRSMINDKAILLKDFCISMTPEIEQHLIELYPNDVAIENYLRSIIMKSFRD